MKLDYVHDTQIVYRKLVHSMSRPGTISRFGELAGKIGLEAGCYDTTVLLAMALLDTEVTFHIASPRAAETARLFNRLTYAKEAEAEAADFIFILSDADCLHWEAAIAAAKAGDLADPHLSATVIAEAEAIADNGELVLTGPGIEHAASLRVAANGRWLAQRAAKNSEYPMGIDLIFIDRDRQAVCLPRTTQIGRRVNESWATSR